MKKSLKNLLLAGAMTLGLAGGIKGQGYPIDVFSPVTSNGIEWNNVENKHERDSLWNNFLVNDWVSEVPSIVEPWDCSEYTRQLVTNNYDWGENINLYDGYSGDPINDSLAVHNGTLRDMGKGGFPVMGVLIPNGQGHEMNAILTGDSLDGDITIWENWNFTEPQFDQMNVQPGQAYMPENCDVDIKYIFAKENEEQGRYLSSTPIVSFHIENGKASRGEINPYVDIYKTRLEANDREFEELSIYSPKPDTTFKENNAIFEYKLKDEHLDLENSYYLFNEEKNYFADSIGSIPLDSKHGLNKLEVYALDKAGNSKSEIVNYTYDTTTTVISKVENLSKGNFYPNPVSTTGTIEYTPNGKDFTAKIYNVSGQELETIVDRDNDGKLQNDFSNYPTGVYFYKTSTGNSGKILKK